MTIKTIIDKVRGSSLIPERGSIESYKNGWKAACDTIQQRIEKEVGAENNKMKASEIILAAMQIDREAFESGGGHEGDQYTFLVESVESYNLTKEVGWRKYPDEKPMRGLYITINKAGDMDVEYFEEGLWDMNPVTHFLPIPELPGEETTGGVRMKT